MKTLDDKPLVLIGDIHGDLDFLKSFIEKFPGLNIIQLGDFGMGFYHHLKEESRMRKVEECLEKADSNLYVIRGNHDDPKYFTDKVWNKRALFLRDYSVLEYQGKKIQLVGGGISVDRLHRVVDESWWSGEKIAFQPDKIEKVDVLLAHVAPKKFILNKAQTNSYVNLFCKQDPTLRDELDEEQVQMQELFDRSEASQMYFGHFHTSVHCTDELNRFYRCVNINEAVELRS